jgi:hypothetical protein
MNAVAAHLILEVPAIQRKPERQRQGERQVRGMERQVGASISLRESVTFPSLQEAAVVKSPDRAINLLWK